jgi:hypothetical protein
MAAPMIAGKTIARMTGATDTWLGEAVLRRARLDAPPCRDIRNG